MRRLFLIPLLCAVTVLAQSGSDEDMIAKLTSDLLALKLAVASDEPLKDDPYTPTELQSVETYSQTQAMKRFGADLANFKAKHHSVRLRPHYGPILLRPLMGADQSYKLAYVLTGKDLSETNLSRFIHALLGMVDSAASCSDTRAPLQDSAAFRTFAENARDALEGLGVSKHDVHIVMDSLFRGAIYAATPQPTFKYQ
jgi:hypothetical protein